MITAVIALGSNLGRRQDTLMAAVRAIARLPDTRLVATSRLRETDPVLCAAGAPDFLNGACRIETGLTARQLLDALLAIEADHGRTRAAPNADRTLDLDLILFGDAVIDEPGLRVPHPHAHERLFVLDAAADVAPEALHPELGRTLADLRDAWTAPADDRGAAAGSPSG